MTDFLMLMWKPFLACLILTGMHVYLGLHVVERKVIFVDLALAQIAALGAVVAVLFHHDLRGPYGYMFSLTATFFGAVIFSLTRTRRERIPQEAVIGIVYAVSAALAILLLSRTAEGDEHIRQMLIGNILLVTPHEIIHMAVLYSLLGMAHWKFRDQFFRISTEPETAFQKGLSVRKWDLLFYVIFGVVVTSSVQIAGVLLVFSFLIIPAVAAMTFVRTIKNRLIFGWAMGTFTSMFGLMLSYRLDLPTGATIVCVFGGVLVLLSIWQTMFYHR